MTPDTDHEEKIVDKLQEIHDIELEAMRRAGVAEEKQEGLRIESTEAVRLFREATGYLLRLRELREDIDAELEEAEFYHASSVVGCIDDYNRILQDIRRNPSFEACIENFDDIQYSKITSRSAYRIRIGSQREDLPFELTDGDETQEYVPMDGTTKLELFVYPRIKRLTKDVENSLIGRCASGKRPS